MLRHYAPDIPTYIVRHAPAQTQTQAQMQTQAPTPTPDTALVLDFGGRLVRLRHSALHYVDLSPSADATEACFRLFGALREAEGEQMRLKGVTHVLLPDLRVSETGADELRAALWERLNRAASGTYVAL
ncbi:hypothetical protein B484DRAFT_406118 [Ochromonadaceae sp. CCMP2298]|nr:hypothetical protein B484DRAFT_406118 [Ochromonadaceae sp. CCMP2298]|mmetsp:Transcript_12534/g.27842  ORF Transcript_12534/g.27842 Transcript_12534/m.27842 type:complete len:129 (+) Transcript_12534:33-419(+)